MNKQSPQRCCRRPNNNNNNNGAQLKTKDLYNVNCSYPDGSGSRESACNAGDLGSILGLGRSPGEANGNPLQLFLPGEFHGQRSLVGYSPWGGKELATTEQVTLRLSYNFNYACFWQYCSVLHFGIY